jgi:competence protein ComEA
MPSFTVSRRHAIAVVVAVLAAVFLATHLLGSKSGPGSVTVEGTGSPGPAGPVPSQQPAAARFVVVDVAGEVRRPGVYRLRQGARITDAVARAGGATRHAQVALVDLAAPLADGEQVLVPRASAGVTGGGNGGAGAGAPSSTAPIDLNTATAEQLDALPGIGPTTAQKIIDYRQAHGPFTSVDQLDAIPGIGAAKIANLKGLVVP